MIGRRCAKHRRVRACRAAEASLEVEDCVIPDEPSQIDLALRNVAGYTRAAKWIAPYIPLYVATENASSSGKAWDPKGDLAKQWRCQHEIGAKALSELIQQMNGFYVKAGQLIATRVDLFPQEYSSELSYLVDSVNPFPFSQVRRVVEKELLGGYRLEDVFESFDEEPLGSASVAQVHRARLHGGQEVAVKVQRPNIEAQLLNDVSVIKDFCNKFRDVFPVDYYTVFSELEEQLKEEFDFCKEADSMERVAGALQNGGRQAPVLVPRSVPGLVCRQVLCMDFVPGVPLSQLEQELERQGRSTSADSRMAQMFGKKFLTSLSDAFAVMIFEEGFFHADPHPGNVFVTTDGNVALIDFGQMKRIGYKFRRELAEMVLHIADCQDTQQDYDEMARLGDRMGLKFSETAHKNCPAALGLYIMDWSRIELPGGYSAHELSPRNVMTDVTYFPREWVLTCRALQLIRGVAARLELEWSLPKVWRESALRALNRNPREREQHAPRRGLLGRIRRWWDRPS